MQHADAAPVSTVQAILNRSVPAQGHVGIVAGLIGPEAELHGDTLVTAGTVVYADGPSASPPNEQTLYRLASCTKTFAATLYGYALLVQHCMSTQDTVQQYLDLAELHTLQVAALATYTSGLPADNSGNPGTRPPHQQYPYTVEAMCTFLTEHADHLNQLIEKQLQQPNPYAYSNLGFGLLVACVLKALNYSSPLALFQDILFTPLGMSASGLMPGDHPHLPVAYDSTGNPVGSVGSLMPAYCGAGGVYTNAADLFRWLHFNMGSLGVEPLSTVLPFLRKQTIEHPRISEGWFLTPSPNASLRKNGGDAGVSSWMAYTGDLQHGAFVLANCSGIASRVGPSVFSALLGSEVSSAETWNELDAAS